MNKKIWTILTLIYMAGILMYSLLPVTSVQGHSVAKQVMNNLLHVPAYGVLVLLIVRCAIKYTEKVGISAMGISIFYGGLNEVVQMYVPGRSASIHDIGLNALGALGMFMIIKQCHRNPKQTAKL